MELLGKAPEAHISTIRKVAAHVPQFLALLGEVQVSEMGREPNTPLIEECTLNHNVKAPIIPQLRGIGLFGRACTLRI